MSKLRIPNTQRARLEAIGRTHHFASSEAFAQHLVERGLRVLAPDDGDGPLEPRLGAAAEQEGYSSADELVAHLLERGLRAYESPETDAAKLEERLRGLGYID